MSQSRPLATRDLLSAGIGHPSDWGGAPSPARGLQRQHEEAEFAAAVLQALRDAIGRLPPTWAPPEEAEVLRRLLHDRSGELVAEDAGAAGVPRTTIFNFRAGSTKRIRISNFNALVALEPYRELDPIFPEYKDLLLELHDFLLGQPEYWELFIYAETKRGHFIPLPSADELTEKTLASLSQERRHEFQAFLERRRERYARERIPQRVSYDAVRQARSRERRGV